MPDDPPPLPPRSPDHASLPCPQIAAWVARRLICLAAVAFAAASIYAFFPSAHWSVRLLTPFRPQLMAGGVALVALGWRLRCGRFTRLAAAAPILINLAVLWPWLTPIAGPAPDRAFRLMAWNTWAEHPSPDLVAEQVIASGADVALLCELPVPLRAPRPLEIDGYQTRSDGQYAIAVREGGPVELLAARHVRPPNCLESRVRFEGQEIRLLVTHASRPTTEYGCRLQDFQLRAIRRWFPTSPLPTVIVGDFNQTPWCPSLAALVSELKLTDTSRGRGLTYTFPGDAPYVGRLIGVPIDQCLLTPELGCRRRWVGDAGGSNHRPVIAEIGSLGG